jgi:hypothetical protein
MALETLLDDAGQKQQRRKLIISIILIVIGIHVLAAVGAGIFVVARYLTAPPAQFEVRKDVRLPAQEREHKMNMAEFDAMTPKPSFNDTLSSLRPTDFAMPDLPDVPMDQMLPLDPSALVSDAVSSLVGTAGMGAGGAGGAGMGGTGDGLSFMGIQTNARRILLVFDVSTSVVNKLKRSKMSMKDIKEETIRLIDKMPVNSRFGIVQFTQNYQFFRPELVPATDPNKEAARQWIDKEWTEAGSLPRRGSVVSNERGLVGLLEAAYKLEPDVIFLISDAGFFWRAGGGIEKIPYREFENVLRSGERIPIHLIAFEARTEDRNFWRRITRRTGGSFKEAQ